MDQEMLSTAVLTKRSERYLFYGLAISTLIHIACSAFLFGTPQGRARSSVTYLDLNTVQFPSAAPSAPTRQVAKPRPLPTVPPKAEEPPQELPQPTAVAAPVPAPVAPEPAAPAAENKPEEAHSVIGMGLSRGYFKSLAEGTTLRADIKAYYMDLLSGINEKWWMDEGADKRKVAPLVLSIVIARNGQIVDQSVMVSSGSRNYDRAVLEAIRKASPLPPLPESYEGDFFRAPIRLVPPLNLLAW